MINMTKEEADLKISKICMKMRAAWDLAYLDSLYNKALEIYCDVFPFEAMQYGHKWGVTTLYNNQRNKIKAQETITINLFGCNVTMNNTSK